MNALQNSGVDLLRAMNGVVIPPRVWEYCYEELSDSTGHELVHLKDLVGIFSNPEFFPLLAVYDVHQAYRMGGAYLSLLREAVGEEYAARNEEIMKKMVSYLMADVIRDVMGNVCWLADDAADGETFVFSELINMCEDLRYKFSSSGVMNMKLLAESLCQQEANELVYEAFCVMFWGHRYVNEHIFPSIQKALEVHKEFLGKQSQEYLKRYKNLM